MSLTIAIVNTLEAQGIRFWYAPTADLVHIRGQKSSDMPADILRFLRANRQEIKTYLLLRGLGFAPAVPSKRGRS